MAVIKEEIITLLRELPDDAALVEIKIAIIENIFPAALPHSKKVVKEILKIEKLIRELSKFIKKSELNPRYFQETIPIEKVRNSFYVERNFHIR
ncbi:MAG: hypothetical protein KGD61_03610 [Candidatus Lokiarchaeota archaeon]|nr:hypothetical protein [Candidatus Lokiarchaeota archaeon]